MRPKVRVLHSRPIFLLFTEEASFDIELVLEILIISMPINLVLAYLLRKFNSRAVAIILLIVFVISLFELFTSSGLILNLLLVWLSVRAVQATFKLKKLPEQTSK